jgi:hypothetical protein
MTTRSSECVRLSGCVSSGTIYPLQHQSYGQARAKELHSIGMVKSIEKERNPLISSFICIKKKLKSKNEI